MIRVAVQNAETGNTAGSILQEGTMVRSAGAVVTDANRAHSLARRIVALTHAELARHRSDPLRTTSPMTCVGPSDR